MKVSVDVELDEYGTNKRNDGVKVYRNAIKAYEGSANKQALAAVGIEELEEDMPFWWAKSDEYF